MKIIFSTHAKQRLLQRGLNKETAISIIKEPDYITTSLDNKKIAAKKLDKLWKVVFTQEEETITVITAYYA